MMLNQAQLSQLRDISTLLVQIRHRDQLSWDDAWSAKYPKCATSAEVDEEFSYLLEKAERIITFDFSGDDYKNTQEHIRTAALESCTSFCLHSMRKNHV